MPLRGLTAVVASVLTLLLPVSTAAVPPAQSPSSCPAPATPPRVLPVADLPIAALTLARCVQADLDAGRFVAASTRLTSAAAAAASLSPDARGGWETLTVRWQATVLVDRGEWPVLAREALTFEARLPWIGPLMRGVAAARASWATQDAALQALARAELRTLDDLARAAGPVSEAERARLVVQGAIAGAQYEREEMSLLLAAAHDLEQRLLGGDEMRPAVVLAWELEADLLRLTDRYDAASARYLALLAEHPRRVPPRIGLAAAYRRLGYAQQADATMAQARALWADGDADAQARLR